MPKTYRECPACGKRALSIATRCPACGHELLMQPIRREEPHRETAVRRSPPVLAASLGAIVVLGAAGLFAHGSRPVAQDREVAMRESATASAPGEAPAMLDSANAVVPRILLDSSSAAAVAAPSALPDSAPSAEAVPRYARTWTKVHDKRSVDAELVAVLLPGDTVLADSLDRGWWRVALEGQVLGYVSARTLTP
jgi:DNA-directed RNA polymerase subunit RPC12/RpoP